MRVPSIRPHVDPDLPDLGSSGELALALQEAFTVLVRLRSQRQIASDAESFRAHIKKLLTAANQQMTAGGYSSDASRLATYAFVAFLDESVLDSGQEMFSGWSRRPLQEEVFGEHTAGETFFTYLTDLVERRATPENTDVLEVFQLCLFLGFHGRYGGDRLQLERFRTAVGQKIDQTRGVGRSLAPDWDHPAQEHVVGPRDPWLRTLAVGAVALLVLVAATFVTYSLILSERIDDLRSMTFQMIG